MKTQLSLLLIVPIIFSSCEREKSKLAVTGKTWDSDGSVQNIQSMHDQAADGDTITLPAGVFTWPVTLNITKAITLSGNATAPAPGVKGPGTLNTEVAGTVSKIKM